MSKRLLIVVGLLLSACTTGPTSPPAPSAVSQAAFSAADCSKDGRVSPAEARTIGLIIGNAAPRPLTSAEFQAGDSNNDGSMDPAEFSATLLRLNVSGHAPAGSVCPE